METVLSFIKKHRFDLIVTCSVFAFLYDVYFSKHTFSLTIVALYLLGYAADNEKSKTNIEERKKLRLRGLTKVDIRNIAFVKSWEETRKKGLIKFSLVYGGVFFGFVLCGIISIAAMFIIKNMIKYVSDEPSHMLNFIGYTYIAGTIGGTVFYRLLWIYNERKFIRLTNPLH
ncbi:hypothetical protein [Mucilaginibacter xinganensis]|uniref:Uncharacterized protein n=1 Tax=Mucilaginibacter xinganensis TaxID=1234841 RepID=A0A223P118_9SPHI|nr:hypothetical protein [Mucilaginibacter xinganensis]ASU35776.1 hypothetical protein MuYL_3891 [Mucilaginibacter xinganensis]